MLGHALAAMLLAQTSTGPTPQPQAQPQPRIYQMHEMDFHFHSGMERPIDMKSWVDLAVRDGRKVISLTDHLELYRRTPADYAEWRTKRQMTQPAYALGAAGHRQLMADFDAVIRNRKDVIAFRAWEISETELDDGFETAPMEMVDLIGWHISPNHAGTPPNGRKLIRRIQQVLEAQKRFPVPMILFHPFHMRFEHIQRKAKAAGRDLASIPVSEYRFFQPGEQEEVARLLRGKPVFIEISRGTQSYWNDAHCREAFIADIRPLAEMGVQFTVSTDAHSVADAERTFRPLEQYCRELGCTEQNTNSIVRELLARKRRQ